MISVNNFTMSGDNLIDDDFGRLLNWKQLLVSNIISDDLLIKYERDVVDAFLSMRLDDEKWCRRNNNDGEKLNDDCQCVFCMILMSKYMGDCVYFCCCCCCCCTCGCCGCLTI